MFVKVTRATRDGDRRHFHFSPPVPSGEVLYEALDFFADRASAPGTITFTSFRCSRLPTAGRHAVSSGCASWEDLSAGGQIAAIPYPSAPGQPFIGSDVRFFVPCGGFILGVMLYGRGQRPDLIVLSGRLPGVSNSWQFQGYRGWNAPVVSHPSMLQKEIEELARRIESVPGVPPLREAIAAAGNLAVDLGVVTGEELGDYRFSEQPPAPRDFKNSVAPFRMGAGAAPADDSTDANGKTWRDRPALF